MSTATPRPGRRRRDRRPPSTGPGERDVLLGFLGYLRGSVAAKVEGAAEPGVRTPGVPSGTNLLGLVTHLTAVERATLLGEQVTDWAATFTAGDDQTLDDVLSGYRDAGAAADRRIAGLELTDAVRPDGPSLRWALVHMIEETGRHAGHADVLRELLDGRTGR